MDTLHDRLSELAEDAPTGGAPAAGFGRAASAPIASGRRHSRPPCWWLAPSAPASAYASPMAMPTAPALRRRIPLTSRAADRIPRGGGTVASRGHSRTVGGDLVGSCLGGGAPEAVGLVAETGTFGTLPIDVLLLP